LQDATWAGVPQRFESGTGNLAAVAAFPKAIEMFDELGLEWVRAHEQELVGYGLERLAEIPDLEVVGPLDAARRGGLISFVDHQLHPHDMATILDYHGVAVRAGHHCAQPLHRRLGVPATVRASFGVYSERSDIDVLVSGIHGARSAFQ